jgi:hypothetical protein
MNEVLEQTHWHISTYHKDGTPPYPDKDAGFIYLTACGWRLDWTNKPKITQFDKNLVDCKECKIYLGWLEKTEDPLSPQLKKLLKKQYNLGFVAGQRSKTVEGKN